MKVRCPGCGKEYPAPALPPGRSATVRCRACGSMFRVEARAPAPAVPRATAPPGPGGGGVRPSGPAPASGRPADLEPVFRMRGHSAPDPGAPVLIADEARPFRDVLVQALRDLGVKCAVVDDGESALRYVQENRPRLLLVNVYLRRLLGIIVCERVKADPQLRSTRVVLIGSLFRKDRFVREPDRLYGADDYIEEAVAPEALRQRLAGILSPALGPAAASAPGAAADTAAPEDLQRLVRIILSDIVLYNPDRSEAAVRDGRFVQEFRVELEEGRRLIAERFPGLPNAAETYRRAVQEWVEARRRVLVS